MEEMSKRYFSEEERQIINKFWSRETRKRGDILHVMHALDGRLGLVDDMCNKGILVKKSTAFYMLSQDTIEYLNNREIFANNDW